MLPERSSDLLMVPVKTPCPNGLKYILIGCSVHRSFASQTYEYATTATLSSFAVAMTATSDNQDMSRNGFLYHTLLCFILI
jgi:hypothetical protein